MGVDAVVYVRVRKDSWVDTPCTLNRCNGGPPGSTHHVADMAGDRYWSPQYRRGDWPQRAAQLLALMADPDVETLWYGGDNVDADQIPIMDMDRFTEYCSSFVYGV